MGSEADNVEALDDCNRHPTPALPARSREGVIFWGCIPRAALALLVCHGLHIFHPIRGLIYPAGGKGIILNMEMTGEAKGLIFGGVA